MPLAQRGQPTPEPDTAAPDFRAVRGQTTAKRALEVAAATAEATRAVSP